MLVLILIYYSFRLGCDGVWIRVWCVVSGCGKRYLETTRDVASASWLGTCCLAMIICLGFGLGVWVWFCFRGLCWCRSFSTCWMWPSTLTPLYAFFILPSSSIMKVERSTPQYSLPYILFFLYTSYSLITFLSGSLRMWKLREYFSANLLWLWTLSALTPSTTAPSSLILWMLSRKAHASLVHPGVSSLG